MDVQALYNEGKYEQVISLLKKDKPGPLLAFAYQKSKLWEEAMNVWTMLIAAYPDAAEYYVERGVCKFNLRFKHAIQDFDQAIAMEDDNAYFYSCRAYIRDKIGDSEGAVTDYTKALELDPEDAITLNNLGLAEQKIGYTARARERFKNSDDLLGIKTIDSRDDFTEHGIGSQTTLNTAPKHKSTLWQEFKKMWSIAGFKGFWSDLTRKKP
jgi:tetratricopeptide (TPR) repeat protein